MFSSEIVVSATAVVAAMAAMSSAIFSACSSQTFSSHGHELDRRSLVSYVALPFLFFVVCAVCLAYTGIVLFGSGQLALTDLSTGVANMSSVTGQLALPDLCAHIHDSSSLLKYPSFTQSNLQHDMHRQRLRQAIIQPQLKLQVRRRDGDDAFFCLAPGPLFPLGHGHYGRIQPQRYACRPRPKHLGGHARGHWAHLHDLHLVHLWFWSRNGVSIHSPAPCLDYFCNLRKLAAATSSWPKRPSLLRLRGPCQNPWRSLSSFHALVPHFSASRVRRNSFKLSPTTIL